MAVATTVTFLDYVATPGQTVLNFAGLSYLEGDGNTTIKVYVDEALVPNWVNVEGAANNGIVTGGQITFTVPFVGAEAIQIKRVTPLTQPNIFPDNYSKETSGETADRTLMQIQEVEAQEAASGGGSVEVHSLLPDWDVGVDYVVDEQVLYKTVSPLYQNVYRCVVAHTSVDFIADELLGYWEWIFVQQIPGPQGEKGLTGDQGPQGIQGPVGPAGNDGIFATVATQVEAEAGVENTHGMTPLRTKEAIAFQVPNLPVITTLVSDVDTLKSEMTAVENLAAGNLVKIEALENLVCNDLYNGSQPMGNNVGPLPLLCTDLGPAGKGVPLKVFSSGTQLARFTLQVLRDDGVETRFEQKNIALHFIDGVWYLGVEQEIVLAGALAEVELSIVTVDEGLGVYSGQVYYTTDNMTGGTYSDRIKWIGTEISVGV